MTFKLIYPEKRIKPQIVQDHTIIGWFQDAVANGEIDTSSYDPNTKDVHEMANALADSGLITLAKG